VRLEHFRTESRHCGLRIAGFPGAGFRGRAIANLRFEI
jgi:hypothetical protein